MDWKKSIYIIMLASLTVISLQGCTKAKEAAIVLEQPSAESQKITHPESWTDETHGNKAEPNYEVVFPDNKVNQIKITITPENWKAMQDNMTELFGAQGTGQRGGLPGGNLRPDQGGGFPQAGLPGITNNRTGFPDGVLPAPGNFPQGALPGITNNRTGVPQIPQGGGVIPGGGFQAGGAGPGDMTPENPMWAPATIEFNNQTWTDVGVRYKGNSSLMSGWNSGSLKLPLKLDFDQFEDQYPEIKDQRFFGFKQLSLSNAFSDGTYMRDILAADILSESGLAAAKTAYYEIILDYGQGPVDLGIYVAIEVINDTVINRFFGEDSGNIYEGEGSGVSLANGTFDRIQSSFAKENNEQEADWSDIETLYNVLHSEKRIADPAGWRKSLESVFDVDAFLEWLAISAIIENWDSYGSMSHNFYLYHDNETGLLTWISWDHNMILGVGGGMGEQNGILGGRGGQVVLAAGGMGSVSLDKQEIGDNWPLIRYLLDDPEYYSLYIDYLKETVNEAFNPGSLKAKCQELSRLIAPYMTKDSGEAAFDSSVQELINHINERYQAVLNFLAEEK